MKRSNHLDDVVAAIRDSALDPDTERAAAERVRRSLMPAPGQPLPTPALPFRLEDCDDFQSLMPSLERGELSGGRRVLLEDHLRSCIPCRRAWNELRAGRPAPATTAAPRAVGAARRRWQVAAVAAGIAVAALAGWAFRTGLLSPREPRSAQVLSIDGTLQRVDGDRALLGPGEWIAERETVRTTEGSSARLRLADGSRIELGERSQLQVRGHRGSVVVRVDRGDVIVEAAKQRDGELSVATDDLLASVKGTVFAVSSGIKGSRVAVLEGRVRVAAGRRERMLAPGEQFLSNVRLARLPFESAISWSQDADRYLEQLRQLRALRRELAAVPLVPNLRYSTRLLDLAPAGTMVYASLPNLGSSLEQVRAIVDRRLEESPALAEWWSENVEHSGIGDTMAQASDLLGLVRDQLGEEVVFALLPASGADASPGIAVAMTELRDPAGFEDALRAAIARLDGDAAGNFGLRFVVDPSVETSSPGEMLLWIDGDLLVVSPDVAGIRAVATSLSSASGFRESRLYRELRRRYDDGTEMVAGVDLGTLVDLSHPGGSDAGAAVFEWTGLADADTLVVDSKTVDGMSQLTGDLAFTSPRRGMAAWLAPPAPMGSLDFVSADATVAAAFLFKDPIDIVDELIALLEAVEPDAIEGLEETESRLGLSLRADLAAPLGGEAAVALDGPALPSPAWKLVLEVVDADRLQSSIEILVARLDEMLRTEESGRSLRLSEVESGGRTYHQLESVGADAGSTVVYAFAEGYLVAAPSRALVDRAIETRSSQYTLLDAPQVGRLMPVDRNLHVSGLVYQNVGSLLQPLAETASKLGSRLSPADRSMMAEMSADTVAPALLGFYGEESSIRVVATTEGGLLGGVFDRLLGAGQLLEMGRILQSAEGAAPQ